MSQSLPPVAVLVAHRVADYAAWKRVFDDTRRVRKDASVFGHDVGRGVDDPDMIYVYCPGGDVDKLTAHVQSPDLKEIMQKAGVEGKPEVWLMRPMSADFATDRKASGMVARICATFISGPFRPPRAAFRSAECVALSRLKPRIRAKTTWAARPPTDPPTLA